MHHVTIDPHPSPMQAARVAYFSMEIALESNIPTYSGGLGVLAGDMIRSAADESLPLVAVTLLHRKGYFRQQLEQNGRQIEYPVNWTPEEHMEMLTPRVSIEIEGRRVEIRAWLYLVPGVSGHRVPVLLLDTDLPENDPLDQKLTDSLYGGDHRYRLCQEAVLGIGGVAILQALGFNQLESFHMNEGHSSLLALALIEREMAKRGGTSISEEDLHAVRRQCIFTTHTPVPAGHDQFTMDLARQILGAERAQRIETMLPHAAGTLNMTHLALHSSRYINGVAMRHGEVSQDMFPHYPIRTITNGVHAVTWTAPAMRELFDRHLPEWRQDNLHLRYAIRIPLEEIRGAHRSNKLRLLDAVRQATGVALDPEVFTIGFARRASTYKRADLLFTDIDRLRAMARNSAPIQVVYGGKAHPHDEGGKALIRRIFEAASALGDALRVVYVPNYDVHWGQLITSGVDIWLNNPMRPQEASGTSGMKAALNGVPNFSVLDGWWVEGHIENFTGWAIGDNAPTPQETAVEAASLYDKLENVILPLYYRNPGAFAEIMRNSIALNGSFFNTQRMVLQYADNAYFPKQRKEDANVLTMAR